MMRATTRRPLTPLEMVLVVFGYACLTVVMTWPFTNYTDFSTASYGGDQRLIIWTLAWDNHAVLTGLPLFQSNLFFPAAESLRYNEHLFGVSLFTLPWAAAGASPVLAHNLTWWLAFPLNGLATFAWLRRFVGASIPAFVGSLAFICSFYVMLHAHAHLHLIWLWPLPLSLLLLEHWFDTMRRRTLALWFLVCLVGTLTSWYVAVMMALVNGLTLLTLLLVPGAGLRDRSAPPASLGARLRTLAVAGVGLGACLYPFGRHYVGFRAAAGEAAAFSATLASYLVPPENTFVGQWWLTRFTPTPGAIWGEQTLFAGWIALALAVLGLGALVRDGDVPRRAWIFPVLVACGFLLSLGPEPSLLGGSTLAPFSWLTTLPGFQGMRAPARFAAVAMLGVGGLAALGVSALARRPTPWRRVVLGALVPLMLTEWFVVGFPAGRPMPYPVPEIYGTPQVQSARSLVSIPEYTDTPEWFNGADYLYYSMSHWRPIVNGFGRSQPDDYGQVLDQVRAFPESAAELHALGVQYVVVHADRLPQHGAAVLDAALTHPHCRLVTQRGSDYLFEIVGA